MQQVCRDKEIWPKWKNRSKLQKKKCDKEIANLSGADFKTLAIRMLTEMIGYGHKIKEEVKSIQSKIKKNMQGTNNDGKETGSHINDLEQKEAINIQSEQNEETRIKKKWGEA